MKVLLLGSRAAVRRLPIQTKTSPSRANALPNARRALTTSRLQIERPTLDDVQRLSEGRAARSRGWGSRQVPHRLNQEERQAFNIAKERGFLTIKGTGYRKERKGAPLANIWRQLNDALGRPCVLIEQWGAAADLVLVDLSPLRLIDTLRVRIMA